MQSQSSRSKTAIIVVGRSWSAYTALSAFRSPKVELIANWNKNIQLGLDLKGGSQLVMQVQLQDAFKAEADSAIERMKDEMQKDGIDHFRRPHAERSDDGGGRRQDRDRRQRNSDQQEQPVSAASSTISSADWILTALNSTDYQLTMKPTAALKLKQDTMSQTMATIERKINALGLAESSVQPTGRSDAEAELLVQLPGVDDPAHVKQLLQTQAVLEWDEVKDGPFASQRRGAAPSTAAFCR